MAQDENPDPAQELQELMDLSESLGIEPEDLDNEVHDAASTEASDINNEGIEAQLTYLLEVGFEVEALKEMLQEIAKEKEE